MTFFFRRSWWSLEHIFFLSSVHQEASLLNLNQKFVLHYQSQKTQQFNSNPSNLLHCPAAVYVPDKVFALIGKGLTGLGLRIL